MATFTAILAAIQTLGTFIKAAQGIIAWMKIEGNKQFMLDLHGSFEQLEKAKLLPPEEQSNAKREVAQKISALIHSL